MTLTATDGNISRTATAIALNDISSSQIALNATNGSIGGSAANTALVVNASSRVSADTSTNNGAIYLSAPSVLPVYLLNTGTTTVASAIVNLTAGTAVTNANITGATDVTADVLSVNATTGITLTTNVLNVSATNTTSGNIALTNTNPTLNITRHQQLGCERCRYYQQHRCN